MFGKSGTPPVRQKKDHDRLSRRRFQSLCDSTEIESLQKVEGYDSIDHREEVGGTDPEPEPDEGVCVDGIPDPRLGFAVPASDGAVISDGDCVAGEPGTIVSTYSSRIMSTPPVTDKATFHRPFGVPFFPILAAICYTLSLTFCRSKAYKRLPSPASA